MSNTITIELCAEDRERLDSILRGLTMLVNAEKVKKATQAHEAPTLPTTQPEAETPTEAEPAEPAKPVPADPAEPTKKVERADVRAKIIDLSAKGLKDKVREVVHKYGRTLQDVPDDKVAECYTLLCALEG